MKRYSSYIVKSSGRLARVLFIMLVLASFSATSLLAVPQPDAPNGKTMPPAGMTMPPAGMTMPPAGSNDKTMPPTGMTMPPEGMTMPPTGSNGMTMPPTGMKMPPAGMTMPPAGMTMPPAGSNGMTMPPVNSTVRTTPPANPEITETSLSSLSKEWNAILEPLQTMPVQDNGFILSANTFAQMNVKQISNKSSFEGQPPLLTVLWLITHPIESKNLAIIKTTHPEFGKLYGNKMISANTYRKTDLYNKMVQMAQEEPEMYNKPANGLFERVEFLEQIESNFAIVAHQGEWLTPMQARAHMGSHADPKEAAVVEAWEKLKGAIVENNTEIGRNAVGALMEAVTIAAEAQNADLSKLKIDLFYHQFNPFMKSAILFVFAAIFYGAALLFRWNWAAWGGYFFLLIGFITSMVGFVSRWILAGRAPLSNMYESFTFAIAGLVFVALVFEAINRSRLAGFGGALLGAIFMIMAHNIDIFDSSIKPLMPALDSIWLTYHVIIIMLSYSAFALSFFISIIYIIKYPFGDGAAQTNKKSLANTMQFHRIPSLDTLDTFNYKVIAVGFPLLTIGIILGAVWANTAWGRPWGFDPKETWSLITWLIYAAYLHVRFIKGWRGLGAAIVAVIGFLAVLFTYYGVNYLLPGLHSYA